MKARPLVASLLLLLLGTGPPAAAFPDRPARILGGFANPALRERLLENGLSLRIEEPGAFARTIEQDRRMWGEVIRAARIRLD